MLTIVNTKMTSKKSVSNRSTKQIKKCHFVTKNEASYKKCKIYCVLIGQKKHMASRTVIATDFVSEEAKLRLLNL